MKELNPMKVFVKVVNTGSFSEAARQLSMSPSSVSRQVTGIEQSLEVRLLHRTTHRISLTEAGQIYYHRVSRILEELEDTYTSLSELQTTPKGNLRINVSVEFGNIYLVPHLAEFLQEYPGIKLDLIMSNEYVDMMQQEVDIAIRYGTLEDSSFVARKLPTTNKLVVGASPEYFERFGTPNTPQDLINHNCLVPKFSQANVWYLKQGRKTHEVRVSGNMESNSGFAMISAIKAGVGLSIIPSWLIRQELKNGEIQTVLNEFQPYQGSLSERHVYALYADRRYLPAKVRTFLDFIISKLEA